VSCRTLSRNHTTVAVRQSHSACLDRRNVLLLPDCAVVVVSALKDVKSPTKLLQDTQTPAKTPLAGHLHACQISADYPDAYQNPLAGHLDAHPDACQIFAGHELACQNPLQDSCTPAKIYLQHTRTPTKSLQTANSPAKTPLAAHPSFMYDTVRRYAGATDLQMIRCAAITLSHCLKHAAMVQRC
jgi:hypothetical protein